MYGIYTMAAKGIQLGEKDQWRHEFVINENFRNKTRIVNFLFLSVKASSDQFIYIFNSEI